MQFKIALLIGKVNEAAQPIIVLFGPSSDLSSFQREIERLPLLKNCVILRKITNFEEEFLLKYSGKGNPFYNKHHSQKTKDKISQSLMGVMKGDKNPFYGKQHTKKTDKEQRDQVRAAIKIQRQANATGDDWKKQNTNFTLISK